MLQKGQKVTTSNYVSDIKSSYPTLMHVRHQNIAFTFSCQQLTHTGLFSDTRATFDPPRTSSKCQTCPV